MRFQNRVNPEGEICFSSEKGTLMGNRGCLHDDEQKIRYSSKRDAWVTCLLSFKERRRKLMQPGQYTELFFLDEATALAAGHRPCAECRRERYKQFLAAWPSLGDGIRAADVDRALKQERAKDIRVDASALSQYPDGVMVKEVSSGQYFLLFGNEAFLWSFGGYKSPAPMLEMTGEFRILTPASTIEAIRNGYYPDIHQSVGRSVGNGV